MNPTTSFILALALFLQIAGLSLRAQPLYDFLADKFKDSDVTLTRHGSNQVEVEVVSHDGEEYTFLVNKHGFGSLEDAMIEIEFQGPTLADFDEEHSSYIPAILLMLNDAYLYGFWSLDEDGFKLLEMFKGAALLQSSASDLLEIFTSMHETILKTDTGALSTLIAGIRNSNN